jgi:hypothetical protein
MHICNITRQDEDLSFRLYDQDLNLIETESFSDVFSLNFYLQTLPRKYGIERTLLIIHNKRLNKVDMQLAIGENSYFIV